MTKPSFARGTIGRAARDELAGRIEPNAAEPFAVASAQIKKMARTKTGRASIRRLARRKVARGVRAFEGRTKDLQATKRALKSGRIASNPRRKGQDPLGMNKMMKWIR